jgi:hypothetical protein
MRKLKVALVEKSAAVLTVMDGAKMTARGRRAVGAWLRGAADMLEAEGKNYAARFRARYIYRARA